MRRDEDYSIVRVESVESINVIGSPAPTGSITKLAVNTSEGLKTIWLAGSTPVEILVNSSWELYLYYSVYSPVGAWAIAGTVIAPNAPTVYATQGKNQRFLTGGSYNDAMSWNMGAMPSAVVSLRVKLFTTDFYTTQLPPQNLW